MTDVFVPNASENPANRLGLDYRALAKQFRYTGPIWDVHSHIMGVEAAEVYLQVADDFGIEKVWSMNPLEMVDPMIERFGDRIQFIAVPDYRNRDNIDAFTEGWLRDIQGFAQRGCKICKFWAAPRGIDFAGDAMRLDSPIRRKGMELAKSLGMIFMTHVADPDTWFATTYADAKTYGTKRDQYTPLRKLLDENPDLPWIGAHMGGSPEDLDFLQIMLDAHPNYVIDTSATKWMVRELSKHADAFFDFCKRNPGRVLFGSDIVATAENADYDLFASRYWALRTLMETAYDGPSPIVDPDLHRIDPSVPEDSTARLRGANFDDATLQDVYLDAPKRFMPVV